MSPNQAIEEMNARNKKEAIKNVTIMVTIHVVALAVAAAIILTAKKDADQE